MTKKEQCRDVYFKFKELCRQGKQNCSFLTFCQEQGVSYREVACILKEEYQGVVGLEGYSRQPCDPLYTRDQYYKVYLDYKELCERGERPGSFGKYCESLGYERGKAYNCLWRMGISVSSLSNPTVKCQDVDKPRDRDVSFENVIVEESGFFKIPQARAITVHLRDILSVSFPTDTDMDALARFVSQLGKEVAYVGT